MAKSICSVDGCDRSQWARGLCEKHYRRWRDANRSLAAVLRGPAIDRLMTRVVMTPGPMDTPCWVSTYVASSNGYTIIRVDGKRMVAHRLSYEYHVGPIPEGLQLDHLCRVRACVNPAHLEPVTCRENILRGTTPMAILSRTDTCKRGHSLLVDDVMRKGPNGRNRRCRTCHRMQEAIYRLRRKQEK